MTFRCQPRRDVVDPGRAILIGRRYMFTTFGRVRNRVSSRATENALVYRTFLATPLLREGAPIGLIVIRRTEVRPFTDKQIKLLRNLRRSSRHRHRECAACSKNSASATRNCAKLWSIRQQPAEVLGIISRSPTDVQPVLDAIVESAAGFVGSMIVVLRLREGDTLVLAGSFWSYTHWPGRDQY